MLDSARVLIVNADDFGRSPGINGGVIKAHEQGIVTSAGLMVRWPAAADAADYARRNPQLSLGLHLDLAEWVHKDGNWIIVYETAPADDEVATEREIRAQLEAFRDLVGADPTHVDTHQHQHRRAGPAATVLRQLRTELDIPVRHLSEEIRYCGNFYGQNPYGEPLPEAVTAENLISLIRELPPGTTELSCHPAIGDDSGSSYRRERELEVEALCDPRVSEAIADEGIELRTFTGI